MFRVFYDPEKSFRGAKLCMVKKRTEAKQINYFANQRIITPYALPLFKVNKSFESSHCLFNALKSFKNLSSHLLFDAFKSFINL